MYDAIPEILAQAQRGICPTCGAPMRLAEAGRDAVCDFCGGGSQLRFTLREIEPEAAKLIRPSIKGATRWLEKQAKYEDCTCPGCGASFAVDAAQSIQTCQYCGAQSKLESRLVPITIDDVPAPAERTRADFTNQRRGRSDYPWDIETEQLMWRVLNEPDLLQRVALADKFQHWGYINQTTAHFLPWLLQQIQRDDDAVSVCAADAVGKLLCSNDPTLWPSVIQSCRAVVFDAQSKPCLVHELGLGQGVCVKTLIDAAEHAAGSGRRDYACQALWAVGTLIGRNFEEIPVIAEIVLYRLFYVTGQVLGWALHTMRNSYLYGRFPIEVLVRAIDEIAVERPEVVPYLLDCIYIGAPADEADFSRRLGFIRDAQSWGGRAAGFELLTDAFDDDALMKQAVELIDGYLDDPQTGEAAESALYRLITRGRENDRAFDDLVKKRNEQLSYRVKREYIRRNPETPLLDTSQKYYWQSDPKRAFDPDLQKLVEGWKEGIREAVDQHNETREACKLKREQARKLDVPVFLRDEPATLPLGAEYTRGQEAAQAEEQRRDDQQSALEKLNSDYMKRIEELSQKMMANMNDQKLVQDISAEMMKLGEDLQVKMQKLLGQ
ncbi:MAG: hypothetical protein R3E76_06480 [Planctomycetota bacterium]